LSKVYKSGCVRVGAPKPIVYNFKNTGQQVLEDAEQEIAVTAERRQPDQEAEANNIIEDAKQLYLKIIEEANMEAQSIIEQAKSDADSIRFTAREEGYNEGYDSGFEKGKEEAGEIIREAISIRDYLDTRKAELYREAEQDILQLVIDISRKIIANELSEKQEVIVELIRQALEKCVYKNNLVLKVSVEDFPFVSSQKDTIAKLVENVSDIEVNADASLSKGSCIVETPSGEVNSSVDVQLKELERAFLYILRNE